MNRARVLALLEELNKELGGEPLAVARNRRRKVTRRPYKPQIQPSDIDVAAARRAAKKAGILPP